MKIGQSLPSTSIGGWPEDEMHKWGSYFVFVPKVNVAEGVCIFKEIYLSDLKDEAEIGTKPWKSIDEESEILKLI